MPTIISGAECVRIFDTTLRDGEQSPGAAMTLADKLRVAEQLDLLGVDVIEAGFPAASPGDFEAVHAIGRLELKARVCGLARARKEDIKAVDLALCSGQPYRLHTFIATSPVHMKYKLNMSADDVLEAIRTSVAYARHLTGDVEWSAEDATRSNPDFLCRCIEMAIKWGATTINIPDTVGYATPKEYYDLIAMLFNRVPGIEKVIVSTHCHNDLGQAVANSLAGVMAGARQVECTMNGIGERAGNAALEEVVMALKVRRDYFGFSTGINTPLLVKTSKLVSSVTGFPVQYNKAIVGKNAFSHESGIHQDGILKDKSTYEIMLPEEVGVKETSLVLGKLSGRSALKAKLAKLGYDLTDTALADVFKRFKALADRKKAVFVDDLIALVEGTTVNARITIASLSYGRVNGDLPQATVILVVDGVECTGKGIGNGPVDAVFAAIRQAYPHDGELTDCGQQALTPGSDAQATAHVQITAQGQQFTGLGTHTDTVEAAALAYVSALAKLHQSTGKPIHSTD